jgi:hypothetical protein
MAKVTPAEADEYLRDVGTVYVPQMDDAEWVKVIGFLLASGFIADADYSTDVGQTMLQIVGDVNADYQAWKADNYTESGEDA